MSLELSIFVGMQSIESEAKIAQEYLARIAKDAEAKFDEHLPPVKDRPCRLHEAMRYSMFAGGKRLRPGLAKATFDMFGGKGDKIWLATSALEMLHTFSLIHDDLPCVDNDDYRRGKLTSHKKFGEATAVMAGDALCIHAFEMMGKTGNAKAIEVLAHLLGTYGMIGGEMTDIECEGKTVDLEIVDYIHYHKTAALIEASLLVGAMLADASESDMEIIRNYGRSIGLWTLSLRPKNLARTPGLTSKRARLLTRPSLDWKSLGNVLGNFMRNLSRRWTASSAIPLSSVPLRHTLLLE